METKAPPRETFAQVSSEVRKNGLPVNGSVSGSMVEIRARIGTEILGSGLSFRSSAKGFPSREKHRQSNAQLESRSPPDVPRRARLKGSFWGVEEPREDRFRLR